MNLWEIAILILVLAMMPAMVLIARGRTMDALVALEFASSAGVLALMLIAEDIRRPSFLDIPLALVLLSYPASLLFAHFYERWL
ncbi:MAG TPA: monovalent cation/H+ antiporter complex subunit F [Chthoniobacteraceae bacterium]|jgi:multisubunit Na+/H+ antiporter MnhF subunit|nr:monovalent cation/H+ antiporter complex subunit F [Chthoniobacteraceae bacterium]